LSSKLITFFLFQQTRKTKPQGKTLVASDYRKIQHNIRTQERWLETAEFKQWTKARTKPTRVKLYTFWLGVSSQYKETFAELLPDPEAALISNKKKSKRSREKDQSSPEKTLKKAKLNGDVTKQLV
jgi:hypothetical protein